MWTPFHVSSWPSSVNSQLPPLAAAKSTMTDPGRIWLTMAALTNNGARPPGTAAVVITTSDAATWVPIISCWRARNSSDCAAA